MVITVINQKGGVGKTTSAINLSAALAEKGKRILLIDLDPQANLSSGLGYKAKRESAGMDSKKDPRSVYYLLVDEKHPDELITKLDIHHNLNLIPSNIELAGAEVEMVNMMSRESILKRKIEDIKDRYDFVIMDCPPSLGLLTINGLVASDKVFIPVQCEYFALEGLGQLLNTVKLVRGNLNSTLDIGGVIMTMYDARTNLAKQVTDEVKNYFKEKVFDTIVPRNIKLSEAPSHGLPINQYDSNSPGTRAYESLADEVIKRFNKY